MGLRDWVRPKGIDRHQILDIGEATYGDVAVPAMPLQETIAGAAIGKHIGTDQSPGWVKEGDTDERWVTEEWTCTCAPVGTGDIGDRRLLSSQIVGGCP